MSGPRVAPHDVERVAWHDAECGSYGADRALWRELASAAGGPILDVGAGTGRVALELAAAGHEVVALDCDGALLAALRERAGRRGLRVATIVADAGGFELRRRDFALIIAPMQTVQLLAPEARRGFLRSARAHLAAGGTVAVALADELEPFDASDATLPAPDRLLVGGTLYQSQPVALRDHGASVTIERVRMVVGADGRRRSSADVLRLHRLPAAQLEREARAAGLASPMPARRLPATAEHVATEVVMLRG